MSGDFFIMNKRGVVLHGRAREIVYNVDKYFECEKQHSLTLVNELKTVKLTSGLDGDIIMTRELYTSIFKTLQNASKVTERVHLATGINKNTLTRIRREYRDAEASRCKIIITPKNKKQDGSSSDVDDDDEDDDSDALKSGTEVLDSD